MRDAAPLASAPDDLPKSANRLLDGTEIALQATNLHHQILTGVRRRTGDFILGAQKLVANAFRRGSHAVGGLKVC